MRYTFKNAALAALAAVASSAKAVMAYVDAQTLLSDAQSLTSGTTVSSNTFDTKTATNDIGVGEPIAVELSVDVAAKTSAGDETYTFNVITSASANLGTPTILNTVAIPRATLVAGYKTFVLVPPGKAQQYVGLQYVLGGTTPTITVTASLKPVNMTETLKYYPKGYTIS